MSWATVDKNRHACILCTVLIFPLKSEKTNVVHLIFFNRKYKSNIYSSMISYLLKKKISYLLWLNHNIFLKATLSKIIDWYIIC